LFLPLLVYLLLRPLLEVLLVLVELLDGPRGVVRGPTLPGLSQQPGLKGALLLVLLAPAVLLLPAPDLQPPLLVLAVFEEGLRPRSGALVLGFGEASRRAFAEHQRGEFQGLLQAGVVQEGAWVGRVQVAVVLGEGTGGTGFAHLEVVFAQGGWFRGRGRDGRGRVVQLLDFGVLPFGLRSGWCFVCLVNSLFWVEHGVVPATLST